MPRKQIKQEGCMICGELFNTTKETQGTYVCSACRKKHDAALVNAVVNLTVEIMDLKRQLHDVKTEYRGSGWW